MKKIIILVLVSILAITPVFANSTEDIESLVDIQPYFTNIYTFHTYFDIDGVGKASLAASLDGHGGDSSRIEAKVQRYSNGTWSTIKTFSSLSSNPACSLDKSYYVTSGYSYRVLYYGYVHSGPIMLDNTNQISTLRYY